MSIVKRFLAEEEGVASIEYAILLGLIVVGLITVVSSIGAWVLGQYQGLDNALEGQGFDPATTGDGGGTGTGDD